MRYHTLLIISVLLMSSAVAVARPRKRIRGPRDQRVERTIAAAPDVVLSVCLMSGSLSVQAWDQNKVRVSLSDGLPIELRRPAGASNSGPAKELTLTSNGTLSKPRSSCLSFGDIELAVPRGTTVQLQTRDADVNVSGVTRVGVVSQGGTVNVERATRFVDVTTIGGNISVENSKASIKLHSVGGSIEAHGVAASAVGDVFEAGTVGGDISLAQISHGLVNVSTVSGDVSFSSSLAHGGRYSFQAIQGDVSLSLPADSSFRLNANLRSGSDLDSNFPLKPSSSVEQSDPRKKRGTGFQHIEAIYGTGDALINLSSFGGAVSLRKK